MSEHQQQHREAELKRLAEFQQNDLHALNAQLKALDQKIATLQIRVANDTNILSAARGLVGMRGRRPPTENHDVASASPRSRPKQRFWSQADGTIAQPCDDLANVPLLSLPPLGLVYTHFRKRFEAPRQSFTGATGSATILLSNIPEIESHALTANVAALKPGTRIWLVYCFDRNSGLWRNFIRPPRAKGGWRVGVFATRSPNRPSPIGLSLAVVEHVDMSDRRLVVSGVDILDETPLLGFRAYEPKSEAHPDARSGWLDIYDGLQPLYYDPVSNSEPAPDVLFSDAASLKLDFVDERSVVDVRLMVRESLKRRFLSSAAGETSTSHSCHIHEDTVLAVGSFRITYNVSSAGYVYVKDVVSGMRHEVCEAEASSDPEVRVHMDFQNTFAIAPTLQP